MSVTEAFLLNGALSPAALLAENEPVAHDKRVEVATHIASVMLKAKGGLQQMTGPFSLTGEPGLFIHNGDEVDRKRLVTESQMPQQIMDALAGNQVAELSFFAHEEERNREDRGLFIKFEADKILVTANGSKEEFSYENLAELEGRIPDMIFASSNYHSDARNTWLSAMQTKLSQHKTMAPAYATAAPV